jgi:hypothetical protein
LFSSCASPAERRHLLVDELAGLEHARAIHHHVDQDRRQLVALLDHPRQIFGRDHDDRRPLLGDHVPGRALDPRVREHPGDVARMPLHHDARPAAAIHANQEVAVQHDVESPDRARAGREDYPRFDDHLVAHPRQPGELILRDAGQRAVRFEAREQGGLVHGSCGIRI